MSQSLANFVHELHFSSTARRPSLPKCPNSPHFRPRACDVAEFWVVTPSFSTSKSVKGLGRDIILLLFTRTRRPRQCRDSLRLQSFQRGHPSHRHRGMRGAGALDISCVHLWYTHLNFPYSYHGDPILSFAVAVALPRRVEEFGRRWLPGRRGRVSRPNLRLLVVPRHHGRVEEGTIRPRLSSRVPCPRQRGPPL